MILGIPYKYFSESINCYIGCNHDDEDDNKRIYLAFDTDILHNKKNPRERYHILTSQSQYVKSIEINRFTILVYRTLDIFKDDFEHFKNGRYSQFSDRYKKILKKIYSNDKVNSILNPSFEDREKLAAKLSVANLPENCEIFDSPYIEEDEIFTLANFIEVDV